MQLKDAIKSLSADERQDILNDYEEHFAIAKEEGKTEIEIADALGPPDKIAKELLAMYHAGQVESKTTTGNMLRAVWAGIGIGFFNLIIVLGPFIAIAGAVIAGWVAAIGLVLSLLLIPVNIVIYPGTFEWADLFFLTTASGIGIFGVIGMYYLTRGLTWMFIRYLKFNASLVKGGLRT